jgi:hypothetical protein
MNCDCTDNWCLTSLTPLDEDPIVGLKHVLEQNKHHYTNRYTNAGHTNNTLIITLLFCYEVCHI